jgi:hypothetical protein
MFPGSIRDFFGTRSADRAKGSPGSCPMNVPHSRRNEENPPTAAHMTWIRSIPSGHASQMHPFFILGQDGTKEVF